MTVSLALDDSIGGKSMDPSLPESKRKTVYSEVSRLELNRMLAVFDFPDPNVHSDGRIKTVNPLQKLFVMNSPFMRSNAGALRQRVESFSGHPTSRILATYQLLFSRPPTEDEVQDSLEFLQGEQPAWTEWAQALLATNEFATID